MANLGGWYLNNKGVLEYRLLDADGEQTTTVLASVAGLSNLKMENDVVKVKKTSEDNGTTTTTWDDLTDSDITITGESGDGTTTSKGSGKIEIGKSILGTSKITVTGNKNLYTAYLDIKDADSKVHIEGTEEITKNTTAGTAVVTGDLSKGFTLNKLDGTATQATYSDAKTNQTLATVSGLAKNYDKSTVDFAETERDGDEVTAGTITLSKAKDGEVSALGTTVIKVSMSTIANNNGIAYYLALGEDKEKEETYAQVEANDEPAYWTVNKTTATYQYYSPTGYTLNDIDGKATQVNITAAKTTVVATVTGLAADLTTNITDENQYPTEVGTGRSRIANEFQSGITIAANRALKKPTYKEDGKTLETDNDGNVTGKGSVTINISKVALPTSGTVTVTAGKDFTVSTTPGDDFNKAEEDGSAPDVVKDQYIWVVSGNKAIYEKVDLAYYTFTDKTTDKSGKIIDTENVDKNGNTITRIICKPQGKATVLATITGLDADYLANEANLVRGLNKDTNGVITHINGINVTTDAKAAETTTEGKKTVVTKAAIPGEITLSSEVLGATNVSLAKSDNYRLALATEDIIGEGEAITDETNAVDLPTFSDYKWNLVGTTATLKGTVTAGYTSSDDGKTITYTAGGVNQTLATVSGLKKGTQLNKSETGDERTIGNYINGSFINGLVIETGSAADGDETGNAGEGEEESESTTGGKLSHETKSLTTSTGQSYDAKILERLPITLSKHVMDGKVTLNSNFFTLAINQDTTGLFEADATEAEKIVAKADSRTYVLTKGELYETKKQTVKGKETEVTVPKSDAEAIVGWHGSLGATATLKTTTPACYELATDVYGTTKTINYTAPPKATTVATIKGLNSAITEDDISFDTSTKKITIKSVNALTTGNVTITSTDYKLALATKTEGVEGGETVTTPVAGLGEATLDNYEWSQATNGTVSFKATVTSPGYQLNADENIITYTKAASTATTLATITGLRTGLDKLEPTDDSGDSDDTSLDQGEVTDGDSQVDDTSWQFNGVEFDEEDGTITLSKSALGTSKVVLSGAGNYKLLVDEDTVDTEKKTAENAADRWVISGTNAIFKKVIPDYYTLTDNTLTYTAATDVKYQKTNPEATDGTYDLAKAGKSIVYGTIQGLKSGLTVDADGETIGYYKDGEFVEAITVGEEDSDGIKVITIKDDGVLDYKNSVKLDATAIASGYRIYLDTSEEITKTVGDDEVTKTLDQWLRPEADENTLAWSINRGTATYKGSIGAGYANSDGTAINYSAANTNATIATITGLNTTLTSVADGDLEFGTGDDTNVITVTADMLGTTDAKLTTNIAILGTNYKLALDEYNKTTNPTGVVTADTVEKKQIWTIDSTNATSTTATYGTWKDNYYTLNDDDGSDTITYHKAGVAGTDKIAKVTGLAGNLVTIQGGQIRGIDTSTANTITLSSSVLPTSTGKNVELENLNGNSYGLALNEAEVTRKAIPTPQKDAIGYKISAGDYATVTITQETSAGFVYGDNATEYEPDASDKTKLVYKASTPTSDESIGEISGLNKNVAINAEGKIDGITVYTSKDEITLSQAALSNQTVKLTTTKADSKYKLVLGDVTTFTAKPVWEAVSVRKGEAPKYKLLIGQATSGYELESDGKQITYKGGGSGTHVATITGLKNPTNDTVKIEGTKIIISAGALNAQEVSIDRAEGYTGDAYTLALNNTPPAEGEEKPAGFVDASESKNAWTLTNGTATFTQTVTAGYAMKGGKVVYTPASSIVSTFNNFNKALTSSDYTLSQDGTMLISSKVTETDNTDPDNPVETVKATYGIKFTAGDSGTGTFEITDANLLSNKNVKLTVKPTGKDSTGANVTADYTIALGDDVAAEVYKPVWNKAENATVATYTRTTAAGYSLDSNSKNIVYSSDPTTVTLATVSGLNKESVVNADKDAIGIQTDSEDPDSFTAGLVVTTPQSGNDTGVIKIGNNVLNNAKVTLGKTDKYTFDLDKDDNAVPTEAKVKPVWAQNKTTAIYKNVSTAYYGLANGEREIVYNKETDYEKTGDDDTNKTTITTITGLKGGITINSDGTVKNADGTSSAGLTAGSSKVTVAAAVLGTTKVASDSYTFVLGDDVIDDEEENYKGKTEWVDIGKGSYTYKTYDKAYYTINTDGNKEITYTTAKDITAYATVSGLKTGLTNANIGFAATDTSATPSYSKGGVLTLGASQLGTGTAKLTTTANATGDFTLALDTTSANKVDESTITSGTEAWTTKTTTATLTGTKTKGYTLSEDEKSITYQAADKTVTLATVKGIKSGATITDVKDELTDSEDPTSTTGNKIITLSASQLGTSNVTVTGDGYKLALGADADKSQNDDPAWVKVANATKATFTQTTYNGFREATDGKSLIYQSKTGTVDVATINGLNKTVTQDQMAIIVEDSGTTALDKAFTDGALVVVNKATNEIYLAKDALTTSAVTLGKNDDYTLKLYGGKDGAIGGEHVDNGIVFDKSTGTMSITTGDAAKWEETDGKTLKYTPSNYTNAATITGLPKDLIFTEDEDDGNELQGITVDGNKITIGAEAVFKTKYNEETKKQETTDESRLTGGSKITLTNYTVDGTLSKYTLEVDSNDDKTADQVEATPEADHKKWVVTTKNLTLKEVTSAHYLASKVTENTRNKTSTQTITYVAEKIGGDLAVITGLPTGIKTDEKGTKVLLSDGMTEVISSTMSGNGAMGDKTVKLIKDFLNSSPDKALTITIAANKVAANQYNFVEATDTDFASHADTGGKSNGYAVDYTTTPTKGTATYHVKKTAGWNRVSNTQITYVTESGELLATFNGLNTSTDYSKSESAVAVEGNTVTVKATALTNKNVTVTTPKGSTTVYKFELDSGVVDDSDTGEWKNKTDWAVGGGTATYKTYDKAYYKLQNAAKNPDTSPNSIVYVAPTKGTAYASITGLNKNVTSLNTDASTYDDVTGDEIVITLGATELEGTTKVSLANAGAKLASPPKNPTPEQEEAVEVQNAITQGHNDTAAKFKLALNSDVQLSKIDNAVWDNNGKVATLTGTTTKGYKLSNDQKTITYQSADSKLQTIAKVTGIKSGSQITDDNVAALAEGADNYNKNLPNLKYITLGEEHLGTDNVVLTGEGYKLALDDEVIEASETTQWQNQTDWVNSNGTFVYKTYNKGYYTLDEKTGMRVTYTAAKDDLKTAGTQHKTYLTISGLSKTADATVLGAAGTVAESSGTITVTTKYSGVITLSDAALNKANVKLTDSQNGGYSLALDEHVTKSTVSNDSAVISGTKATWTGTQGKGYLLANDEQNITYYSAAKTKQTIATVTGLASGITSANNDAFSEKYDAETNTVTLGKDDLSTNVVIGGTAEFKFKDDFTGSTVTGSAAADKMTFGAGNNTVNTGAGNDIVDFASKGGNTYLYANKSGNDVIRGFKAESDVIRITNVVGTTSKITTDKTTRESTTTYTNNITVAQDTKIAADTLVKVGANTIRLKGVTAASVNVYDKNGYIWSSTATNEGGTPNGSFIKDTSASSEGDNVFADDNYAMTPNLSSIVKNSTASYTADDLVADDATALTKQSTAVSYSDKK